VKVTTESNDEFKQGSPRCDKPKKAFGAYNEKYSNKVDFGLLQWRRGGSRLRVKLKWVFQNNHEVANYLLNYKLNLSELGTEK
jgi:hypothetical protein